MLANTLVSWLSSETEAAYHMAQEETIGITKSIGRHKTKKIKVGSDLSFLSLVLIQEELFPQEFKIPQKLQPDARIIQIGAPIQPMPSNSMHISPAPSTKLPNATRKPTFHPNHHNSGFIP